MGAQKWLWILIALPCGLFACGEQDDAVVGTTRQSALLITIDTLRADHVGVYGYPERSTPVIDALAARGVVFERAIAASSRTAPSHASILTSRFVRGHAIGHRNGSTQLRDEPTLAEQLQREGYRTAAFVSNAMLARRLGLDRGFEVFDNDLPHREHNRLVFERHALDTERRASDWLRTAKAPWLLWVQFNDPHGPYELPMDAEEEFTGAAVNGVPPGDSPLPVLQSQRGWNGIPAYQQMGSNRRPSEYRSLYASEIRRVDRALATLLEAAENSAGDNLVILLTADHGESLGEQGFYFGHGHATTPELVHVPFVLVAPELEPGRFRGVVHHVDVTPTLLDLLGSPALPGSAGVSLAPIWRSQGRLPDRVVFADVGTEVTAYRGEVFERLRLTGDLGDTPEGSRRVFAWRDAGWEAGSRDRVLTEALDRYTAKRANLAFAQPPDSEERQKLEALGYIEPSGAAVRDTE